MKTALQQWARSCLLIALVVLGTFPLDARAEGAAGPHTAAGPDRLMAAETCCSPEALAGHGECLPVCGPAGQALAPDNIELPLLLAAKVRPAPDLGVGGRFADLEPHPPRRLFDST